MIPIGKSAVVTTLLVLAAFTSPGVSADPAVRVWQTEPGDSGGYLHVKVDPCGDKLCGAILRAFDKNHDPVSDYEHLGKPMIMKMRIIGDGHYAKGKIWAPDVNKIYKSKMQLDGENLIVQGCIAFICRSQTWKAVSVGENLRSTHSPNRENP